MTVNGAAATAVSMATNNAPHNLSEVTGGLVAMIDNPDIDLDGLMKHIKGPDFPTGGGISREGIREAFETGRGSIRVRGRARLEERAGRISIAVSASPYRLNQPPQTQTTA